MHDGHDQSDAFIPTDPNPGEHTPPEDGTFHDESQDRDAPAPATAADPADESMSLLDRMEHELRSLRTLAAERAALSLELDARRGELERREAELQELERRTDQREAELEQAQQRLVEDRERIAGELQQAEARVQEIERRASEAGETEQRINQRASELEEQAAEIERKRETLELRSAEIEARECSVSSEHEEVARLRTQVDGLRDELSRTRTRLAEAGRMLEESRNAPAPETPGGPGQSNEFLETRKRRLAKTKELLAGEAEKVAQVKEALKRRQKELQKAQEQIVEKQKELQKARDTRDQAERMMVEAQERSAEAARLMRRAEVRASKGKASMFIAGVLVSLAVACGASWLVVDRAVPATYLASSQVAIDHRDVDPTPQQIEAWRAFVAGLPTDPQFLERAADRLHARGFDDLGAPTDLRHALADRLELTSERPGELTMTMRGLGAGKTERTLETLTTTIVAYANDTRELREDRSSTRVVTPARAEGEPIEDPRLAAFGIAAGIASGIVLILTVLAWRSLRAGVGRDAGDELSDEPIAGATDAGLTTEI